MCKQITGKLPRGKVQTRFYPGFVEFAYQSMVDYADVAGTRESDGQAHTNFIPFTIIKGMPIKEQSFNASSWLMPNADVVAIHEARHIANYVIFKPKLYHAEDVLDRPSKLSHLPADKQTENILWNAYGERYKDEIIAYISDGATLPEIKQILTSSSSYDYLSLNRDYKTLYTVVSPQPSQTTDKVRAISDGFALVKEKVSELIDTAFEIRGLLSNKIKSRDLAWLLSVLPIDRWNKYRNLVARLKYRNMR